jgi:hypothetical protein
LPFKNNGKDELRSGIRARVAAEAQQSTRLLFVAVRPIAQQLLVALISHGRIPAQGGDASAAVGG